MANKLLSFKEWNRSNPSVPFADKLTFYQRYLESSLITEVEEANTERNNQLKESYKGFLRRLTVIYDDDPEIKKLEGLDFDDDQQLISAIPIFATKIRDIARFYKKKRKELSKVKEQYSVKGTEQGLDRAIRYLFLNRYAKDGDYFDPSLEEVSVVGSLQERTELNRTLGVEIEELYNV